MENNFKHSFIAILIISIIISSVFGGIMGFWAGTLGSSDNGLASWINTQILDKKIENDINLSNGSISGQTIVKVEEESAVIQAAEDVSPAVVSISLAISPG